MKNSFLNRVEGLQGNRARELAYSHTLPIRLCAAQRDRDFEAPDFERKQWKQREQVLRKAWKEKPVGLHVSEDVAFSTLKKVGGSS